MTWWEMLLLAGGGVIAGIINTVAGGGSMLTVPLLVLAGVPGNSANGSNRLGILTSTASATVAFRRLGVDGLSKAIPVLAPTLVGSLIGSLTISRLPDRAFEIVFGVLMIPLIVLTVRKPTARDDVEPWPTWLTIVIFGLIGAFGGAFQAGIGLVLLAALTRAGFDFVTANSVKMVVSLTVTVIALPVFLLSGNIVWLPAIVLAAGFFVGGWCGAQVAVKGGEKLIRIAMVIAAIGLSGRLIGLY